MFNIGYWDEDTAQIGIARSRDGITGWERHPYNPVLAPAENEWDNGRRGASEQIGMAVHEGEDLGF